MKRVFVAQHDTEAHLVKSFLESQGIEALVQGEAISAARGEAPMDLTTLPSVWVMHDERARDAVALIEEHRRGPTGSGSG